MSCVGYQYSAIFTPLASWLHLHCGYVLKAVVTEMGWGGAPSTKIKMCPLIST
jgi:hypothetical protein